MKVSHLFPKLLILHKALSQGHSQLVTLEHIVVVTLGLNVRISRLLRHLIDIGSLVRDQL